MRMGFGSAQGNKGGVAVRARVYDTWVCFVCAHLAAHESEVDRRNTDYREINSRLVFPEAPLGIDDHEYDYRPFIVLVLRVQN